MKKQKKKIKTLLLFIILLGLTVIGFGSILLKKMTLQEDDLILVSTPIEYGSEINSKDLIQSANVEIIEYPHVSTLKVGKQSLIFIVKKGFSKLEISKEIEVVDTQKPIIEIKEDQLVLNYGEKRDLKSNVLAVYDVVDKKEGISWEITDHVNILNAGKYKAEIKATDKNGNTTIKSFEVVVKEKQLVGTYINGILLVNKEYPIPASFGGYNEEATNALAALQKGAMRFGYSMPLLSGYRSYETQKNLYNNYVASYGQTNADTFSARPGHSEHQTGLAFDVGEIDDNFGNTPAGMWLKNNCASYGFIIRYTKGKESITGYKSEPWHIRYVGVEHAQRIMSQNICLEEYLGVN